MGILRKGILFFILLWSFCIGVRAQNLAVERQVYSYLIQELGLPSASACGVLANIEHESAFNVNAVGDQGTSYGLCQWHAGRYSALKTYCLGKGLDYQTVEGQLAYLKYELQTNYADLFAVLRVLEDSPSGAYRAAYLWCVEFERPSDMENKAVSRGTLARGKYWNRYNSVIMLQEEEEDSITQEEAVKIVQQMEVERYKQKKEVTVNIRPFIPWHRPRKQWHDSAATGFAVAVLFMPLSDGKKERYLPQEPQWLLQEV